MTQRLSTILVLMASISANALALGENDARTADIQRELDGALSRMMAIWPGVYHNDAQIEVDKIRGYTSWRDGGHAQVTSSIVTVNLPEIGENLLYVEDYLDGDPKKIFRQKLYALSTDVDRSAIKLTLHSFHDPEGVAGAHTDPSKLQGLSNDDIRNREGCEMYFRPLGDGYSGAFDYGACTTDTGMVADNRIFLAPGHYWFSDQFRPADAPRPHVSIGQNWHRLVRVD